MAETARLVRVVAGGALALSICGTTIAAVPDMRPIGTATQEADGTIVLMLRAEEAGGTIGDAQLRYPPDHKDYTLIARHVGPIPHGQAVAVPPFPER